MRFLVITAWLLAQPVFGQYVFLHNDLTYSESADPLAYPERFARIPASDAKYQTNGVLWRGVLYTRYISEEEVEPHGSAADISNRVVRAELRQAARSVRQEMLSNINSTKTVGFSTNALAAQLPVGFTAAQNRQLVNDLRREVTDAQVRDVVLRRELIDTQQQVVELTKVVQGLLRGRTP